MATLAFESAVRDRLEVFSHLQPIFHDYENILRQHDPGFFLVFNHNRQKHELHNLRNKGYTHCLDVPDNKIDSRLEELIRHGSIRVRGDAVFGEIEEHNNAVIESEKRKRQNDIRGIAEDMYPYFKKVAWEGY